MNTALLRLATKHPRTGVRQWTVPGFGNAASLTPSAHTMPGWGAMASWPMRRDGEEILARVDLNRHRAMARAAARALLAR